LLKVATPLEAVTVRVPETPAGFEAIVTEADEFVTVLLYWSSTVTAALKTVPAVSLEGGWVVKASLLAIAAPMLMPVLVARVRVPDVAFSVYVPAVSRIRLLKVATPFDAETVGVAELSQLPDDGVSVIEAEEDVTTLPPASSTVTTAVKAVPAVPVGDGSVVKTSLLAAPTPMVMPVLVAGVSVPDDAVSVYGPTVSKIRLLNVATPLTAETAGVAEPSQLPDDGVSATEAEEFTVFPYWSSMVTTAPKAVPAVPVNGGSLVKTSLLAVAAPMVMLVLVAVASDPDEAVSL